MHRLSLSSPSVKLHGHGGSKEDSDNVEEPKLRDSLSSSAAIQGEDDDTAGKIRRSSLSPPSRTDNNFIHLLPILIFLCFLLLYLFSHTPSASEMAQFRSFNRFSKKYSDSAMDLNNIRRLPAENTDIFPIRTVKILQETRMHRKFANF